MRSAHREALRRRGISPAKPRWCEPGPTDERCDVCRDHHVPFHDVLLCPHERCYWDIQVCDACGGYDAAHDLLVEHLAECAIAKASEAFYDSKRRELVVPSPQLGLFASPAPYPRR